MPTPHHKPDNPSSTPRRHPEAPPPPAVDTPLAEVLRRAAENLPPPLLIFLFSLFAIYVVFSSSTSQSSISTDPDFHIVAPPILNLVETFISTTTVTATATATVTTNADIAVNVRPKQSLPKLSSSPKNKMSSAEQTFIAIKPDGVQRGLIGTIISRFENRGFKLVSIKLVTPPKDHLEAHYADLKEKPFFPGLIDYMLSGPICAMIWEGRDAVKTGRSIIGATNPLASTPGTIRGDFCLDTGRNLIHGSDSVENAKKEISLWFKEGDVVSWDSHSFSWIYEKP